MLDEEVVITPFLEVRIVGDGMSIAGIFVDLMKVDCVFFEEIARGEVGTTTEPPTAGTFSFASLKVAVVGVHGWSHGVVGMENEADASCVKVEIFFSKLLAAPHAFCCLGAECPVDNTYVYAGLLKDLTAAEDSAPAATAFCTLPGVLSASDAVDLLKGVADCVLGLVNHVGHYLSHL